VYALNDAHQAVVDRVVRIADQVVAKDAHAADQEGRFPRASLDALAAEGLFGLTVPTTYGGMGESLRTACAVLDEIAQRCPSTAMVYKMHLAGVTTYVAAGERMAHILRTVAEGKHLTTLAWSETGSRSQFWAPVSRPSRNGTGLLLHADKSFVTSAGEADGYVVSTQWIDGASPMESMLYLVLADDEGIEVGEPWNGIGMRGNASSPMKFEGTKVDGTRALTEEGKGLEGMLGVVLPALRKRSANC
jgi:alkylation response protein AidB-like acyl-CoA dehydrogenase